jgi:hypothetical protein
MKKKRVSKERLRELFEEVTSKPGITAEVTSSLAYPSQCNVQWFFEPDWRTDECRKADEHG